MIFFKTRHEVKRLQSEIDDLRDMLKAHFDIKWTLADFADWYDSEPKTPYIPVTKGEWKHYNSMLSPIAKSEETTLTSLSFRDKAVKATRKYTSEEQ